MNRLADIPARYYPWLLAALWAVLVLPTLGLAPLFDYDETIYAQTAVDMMRLGEWIVPTANGMQFFEKPPFTYYMMDICFSLFGQNAWAARLPSALFTLATVLILFRFGRDLYSARFGVTAALVFFSMLEVGLLAHAAILDAVLNFFIAAALLNYWRWMQSGRDRDALWCAAMIGAAVSIKGPVGVVVPVLIIVIERLLAGELKQMFRQLPWLWAIVLFLLTATPWYLMILIEHGPGFLYEFIVVQNIGRAMNPMQGHGGRWHYYIIVFAISVLPWLAMTPWLLRQWSRCSAEAMPALIRFCLIWAGVVFVLFTLAQTKLPHYISSMYPAIALAIAVTWQRYAGRTDAFRRIQRISAVILLPLALALICAPLIYPLLMSLVHHPRAVAVLSQDIRPGLEITLGGMLLLAALVYLWCSRHAMRSMIVAGLILQSALLIPVGGFAGKLAQGPQMRIAEAVAALPETTPVFSYNLNFPSISFRSKRSYRPVLNSAGQALLHSRQQPYALILRSESLRDLPWLAGRTPLIDQGGFLMYLMNMKQTIRPDGVKGS